MNRFIKGSLLKLAFLILIPFCNASLLAKVGMPPEIANDAGIGKTVKIQLNRVGYKPVPIILKKDLVTIDVLINNHAARALIDTGSKFTILSHDFQSNHHINLLGHAQDILVENINRRLSRTESLDILIPNQGTFKLNPLSFDMKSVETALGEKIDVIIGQDILRNVSTLINLKDGLVYFAPPGSIKIDDNANTVNISKDFTFQVKLNNSDCKLLLDTGSNSNVNIFSNSISGKEPELKGFQSVDAAGNIINGKLRPSQSVDIGKDNYKVDVGVTDRVESRYDGIAGMKFIRYDAVLIDPEVGKLTMVGSRH